AIAAALNTGNRVIDTFVVEAHAIDDGLFGGQPEQSRPGIARLWPRRQRAYLYETEAQRRQRIDVIGVLVQACRQADWVGKAQPHDLHFRHRGWFGQQSPRSDGVSQIEQWQGDGMGCFGRKTEQKVAQEAVHLGLSPWSGHGYFPVFAWGYMDVIIGENTLWVCPRHGCTGRPILAHKATNAP